MLGYYRMQPLHTLMPLPMFFSNDIQKLICWYLYDISLSFFILLLRFEWHVNFILICLQYTDFPERFIASASAAADLREF